MTDDLFAMIGQARCQKLWLDVPWTGPWVVRAILDDLDATVTGQVTITLGTLKLVGTVDPQASGVFAEQRSVSIVAGAGGWGTELPPKWYQQPSGLNPLTIAQDAARECGEQLGSTDFGASSMTPYEMRPPGPASNVLEHLLEASGGSWWVDQSGLTNCGQRPILTPQTGTYSVLAYSPMNRWARIQALDPAALWVGSVLTDRFKNPKTIRSMVLELESGKLTMYAWVGEDGSTRIGHALDALITKYLSKRLLGKYLYRVFAMDGNKVNLQAARSTGSLSAPLSDALPVTLNMGLPGCWSKLTPGSLVWVEFGQGGDPNYPIVTAPGDKDSPNFMPQSLDICVGNGETGKPIAGLGDAVDVIGGTATLTGSIDGVGLFTAEAVFTTPLVAIISTGSNRANVGAG